MQGLTDSNWRRWKAGPGSACCVNAYQFLALGIYVTTYKHYTKGMPIESTKCPSSIGPS